MGFFKQKFRSVKKLPDWIFWVLAVIYRIIFKCFYRVEIVDPMNYRPTGRGMIGLAWHNRLLFFPVLFPAETRRHTTAVISASRDGQYIADFAAQFGLESLRGSSTRGGASAQRAAIQAIKAGKNVIFTPDGPRGPRYEIKRGPVQLASLTGTKIVPLAINASSCWALHSWDGFQIPKPFSKLTLVIGEGIDVPPDLDDAGLEFWRKKVEAALLAVTKDPVP